MGNPCSTTDPCRCSKEQCIVTECGFHYGPQMQRDISNKLTFRMENFEPEQCATPSPKSMVVFQFRSESPP